MASFGVIGTHLPHHFLRAVDYLGLRRNGSSSQVIDQAQNFLEQTPWYRNLGQAKGIIKLSIGENPTVESDLGTVKFQLQATVEIDS